MLQNAPLGNMVLVVLKHVAIVEKVQLAIMRMATVRQMHATKVGKGTLHVKLVSLPYKNTRCRPILCILYTCQTQIKLALHWYLYRCRCPCHNCA